MKMLAKVIVSMVVVAIAGIIVLATMGMPVTFAASIATLVVGAVTAAVRYWPTEK